MVYAPAGTFTGASAGASAGAGGCVVSFRACSDFGAHAASSATQGKMIHASFIVLSRYSFEPQAKDVAIAATPTGQTQNCAARRSGNCRLANAVVGSILKP